jgi:hypothetical protein
MFDMWQDNLERELQWTQDQGQDQGQDLGQDQLVQDQELQERRYPSRKRQLTAKAAVFIAES